MKMGIGKQIFGCRKQTETEGSRLGRVLREIVLREGIESYTNTEHLARLLKNQGIEKIEIRQVELVLESGTFLRYKDQFAQGITAADINNIIQTTAVSGLSAETIRTVVSDLLFGIGISQNIRMEIGFDSGHSFINKDIYILPTACEKELKKIESAVTDSERNKLSEEQFGLLNYCALAGIPRAARILGEMYLDGTHTVRDIDKAAEYLTYAVRTGDVKSMAFLGKYYYERGYYNEAYELLTGPGTFVADSGKRQLVDHLCDIKIFNMKTLVMWLGLAFLIEVFLLFIPSSPVTGIQTLMTVICSLLNLGVVGLLLWNRYKRPFSDLRQYGFLFIVVVFIYLFVYIV